MSREFSFYLVIILSTILISIQYVQLENTRAQTITEDDLNEIHQVIRSSRNSFNTFWSTFKTYYWNLSDEVRYESIIDVIESRQEASTAETYLENGEYGFANRSAYHSLFLMRRASYRFYTNMTWSKILEANSTITSIPRHIPISWESKETLNQAIAKYETYLVKDVLESSGQVPPLEAASAIKRMTNTEKEVFSDQDSAYNLAIKAKNQMIKHLKEQDPSTLFQIKEKLSILQIGMLVPIVMAAFGSISLWLVYSSEYSKNWFQTLTLIWKGGHYEVKCGGFYHFPGTNMMTANGFFITADVSLLAILWQMNFLSEFEIISIKFDTFIIMGALILTLFFLSTFIVAIIRRRTIIRETVRLRDMYELWSLIFITLGFLIFLFLLPLTLYQIIMI